MKTNRTSRRNRAGRVAYIAGAFLCASVIAAVAGYCVAAAAPEYCGSVGGWRPGRTSVFCDLGGGVLVEFYNGVKDDPVTIYRPTVTYTADSGYWNDKVGPLQTSGSHIYSVANCVQTIEDVPIVWVGCSGRVPDEDSGDCPTPHG
jgi:hypothetical protein